MQAERSPHLSSPHEPQLKDVHMTSTLQRFVPGVVGQVVLLVLLEQVAGVHLVAALHQTLRSRTIPALARVIGAGQQRMTSRSEGYLLSDQQGRALQRNGHHLVWVPCHRVGPVVVQHFIIHCSIILFNCLLLCVKKENKLFSHLSTPFSFHLCLLDISRLPPHAP